jgi:hypothetical protein
MNFALMNTRIQISHTTGDTQSFPIWVAGNCHPDTAAINECIADVCDGLFGKALGQCRNACTQQHQICSPVCMSTVQTSFIHWGEVIVSQSDPQACSPTTCPVCPVATQIPSLQDSPLYISPTTKRIDLGPLGTIDVVCRINQWQFLVSFGNLSVTSASSGLTVHVPGTAASPAIDCSNSPDISVSGLGLAVTFHPAMVNGALDVSADGALEGTFSGGLLDFLADVDAGVKSSAASQFASNLNSPTKKKQYAGMFNGLVGQFLFDNHLPPVVTLLNLVATPAGLTVTYQ